MDKSKIITAFIEALFKSEAARIDKSVERLDRENREILKTSNWGFMWQGQRFVPKNSPYRVTNVFALDFSLRHEGNFLLKDIAQVGEDEQMIRETIALLIERCETEQDLRDALPDALVELSPKLMALPREREAGYTLRGNERALRQFTKILDKIHLYAATRMMY